MEQQFEVSLSTEFEFRNLSTKCKIFTYRDGLEEIATYQNCVKLLPEVYIWKYGLDSQFYHDQQHGIVYILPTATAIQSISICGSKKEGFLPIARLFPRNKRGHFDVGPQYHQNVTYQGWIADRYEYLEMECLYGQDNEFNIFRSMCFLKATMGNRKKVLPIIRLSIGILCLILQIILSMAICIEVGDNWDVDEMFDKDGMIIAISFLVFSFISYSYAFTVYKYFEFYGNMRYLAEISWLIIILDFISNIIVGFIICLVSFAYLLQSESIGDVVLNSFALTFILELDDMANLFDSDENVLMAADYSHLSMSSINSSSSDWEIGSFKRNIKIDQNMILISICLLLLSPLFILASPIIAIAAIAGIQKDKEPNKIKQQLNQVFTKNNYSSLN